MICPFCLHAKTKVYNTRSTKKSNSMWRRRRCLTCKKPFTTSEEIDYEKVMIVTNIDKKTSLPFMKAKLLLSLAKMLDHRKDNSAYNLCNVIEQGLVQKHSLHHNETSATSPPANIPANSHSASPGAESRVTISNDDIIIETLTYLKNFDTLAYIKYLSYYSGNLDSKRLKKLFKD